MAKIDASNGNFQGWDGGETTGFPRGKAFKRKKEKKEKKVNYGDFEK